MHYLAMVTKLAPPPTPVQPQRQALSTAASPPAVVMSPKMKSDLEAAKKLMFKAQYARERMNIVDARQLYIDAAEAFMKLLAANGPETFCKAQAAAAIQAAESIGVVIDRHKKGVEAAKEAEDERKQKKEALEKLKKPPEPRVVKEDQLVLAFTSRINGKEYPPFSETDAKEEALPTLFHFSDPDGLLALSDKQKAAFGKWARPTDIARAPKMIPDFKSKSLTSKTIRQSSLVSDSSFISALCIAADFDKRLVGTPIY